MHFSALARVGAIERVMIEWQDGCLDITAAQLVDKLTATLTGGFAPARRAGRAPRRR